MPALVSTTTPIPIVRSPFLMARALLLRDAHRPIAVRTFVEPSAWYSTLARLAVDANPILSALIGGRARKAFLSSRARGAGDRRRMLAAPVN